jgi:radical SAM superfamily enzyme YgiQ (UPF0313 family)
MKVLLISANTLAASPAGPAYVAGAALRAGHTVQVFECLFAQDMARELRAHIALFAPDVIGISIRLVHGYMVDETAPYHTRHLDLRKQVREVVGCVRNATGAPILLGGPGFNYYAQDWLEYLDLDYGIRGEADLSFPLYLERLEQGSDLTTVSGCVYRRDGQTFKAPRELVANLDETAFPAYELFDLEQYSRHGISPAVLTKRGCAFRCMYCPYASLEGSRYRVKSPARVVDEVERVHKAQRPKMVTFAENNFNVPKSHAEAICREMLARGLEVRWGTGDLRPMGVSEDFCRLLKNSGCDYLNLSVESASETMLARMGRGYTVRDVRQSLASLEKSGIPFGVSLMLGAPGETPATVAESLALVDEYTIPLGTWVTIGICLWTPRQAVLKDAREAGQLRDDRQLFAGVNYVSPELPREYMVELIETLHARPGYDVQVNKPFADFDETDRLS